MINKYYKIDVDKGYIKAKYDSESEKCVIEYRMSLDSDHPLRSIFDKDLAFRKKDIRPLIEALQQLEEELDAAK